MYRQNCKLGRRGITLVEMLVSMAITLVMMAAVVTLFDQIGQGVNDSRGTIEMSSRLRGVRNRLQTDLAGLTCPTIPWTRPEAGVGYFEYVEGFHTDLNPTSLPLQPGLSLIPTNAAGNYNVTSGQLIGLGDYDDILMFTVRSRGEPFVGKFGNTTIESPVAEVVWYCVENPGDGSLGEPGLRTIYRRVLLVAPWTGAEPAAATLLGAAPSDNLFFFNIFDLSSHVEGTRRAPNSLGDLTKREYRFAHRYLVDSGPDLEATFPHAIRHRIHSSNATDPGVGLGDGNAPKNPLRPFGLPFNRTDDRRGEDVMLTNVLAFNVKAYDPAAPLYASADGTVVGPSDPAWRTIYNSATVVGKGAYVDLAYSRFIELPPTQPLSPALSSPSYFSDHNPGLQPQTGGIAYTSGGTTLYTLTRASGAATLSATYDTWSFHYEHDGIDQDNQYGADQGTNGFDDYNANGVDDIDERETSPPYTVPLRGIEVKIRVYEPDSRQIREVTVRQSFVPE